MKFSSYIYKILKLVYPNLGISSMGMQEINKIVDILIKAVVKRANLLVAYSKKQTIYGRDIQIAVMMLLPKNLSKKAVSDGTKALVLYEASLSTQTKQSLSSRAGLTFPIKRTENAIRALSTLPRVSVSSGIYLAAVLENIVGEILHYAGIYTIADKKVRITPKHIRSALTAPRDVYKSLSIPKHMCLAGEFSTLFQGVIIAGSVIRPETLIGCQI